MPRVLILLLLAGVLPAQKPADPLRILEAKTISSHDLVTGANALIAMGKEQAVQTLKARLKASGEDPYSLGSQGERMSWLCRLIFEGTRGTPLRQPLFGGTGLPYKSMPLTTWPRYPLAVEAGVPFVLSEGYVLAGMGEPAFKYLEFCATNGRFRTRPYPVPTRASATAAWKALTTSKRWKALKWHHKSEGLEYTINEQYVIDKARGQAERTPQAPR